jgi:hypothetical protein
MGENADRIRTGREPEVDVAKWLETSYANWPIPKAIQEPRPSNEYSLDLPGNSELKAVRSDEEALRTFLDLEAGLKDAFCRANIALELSE